MKKVSVSTLKNFIKENDRGSFSKNIKIGEDVFTVNVKTNLTVDEKSVFVARVVNACFDITGDYRPEYLDPMFNATLIQVCTDLPVISLKREKGEEGQSYMDIDAMAKLCDYLDLTDDDSFALLTEDLMDLCMEAIEYRIKKEIADRQNRAMSKVGEAAEAINKLVSSIDMKELVKIAAELSENTKNLDEKSLVNAIIERRQ